MKAKENWTNKLTDKLSEKYHELKQVALANKLHQELETKSLEQVLADHLPVSEREKLTTVAADMHHAIKEMYSGLGKEITDDWVHTHLNSALDGLPVNKQGQLLVNLLHCACLADSEVLSANDRWPALRDLETFTQEDITELIDLALKTLNSNADFLARQEFLIMENVLENLPRATVEAQINSGPKYAEAYAAAMYISEQRTPSGQNFTPYQLGLQAAKSVESSHILALYHYGKLRAEDAMEKLSALSLQFFAFAFRAAITGLVTWASWNFFMVAGITSTAALILLSVAVVSFCFYAFPQEEVVLQITEMWSGIKHFVGKIINFFRGDVPSSPPTSTAIEHSFVDDIDEQNHTSVETPSISV